MRPAPSFSKHRWYRERRGFFSSPLAALPSHPDSPVLEQAGFAKEKLPHFQGSISPVPRFGKPLESLIRSGFPKHEPEQESLLQMRESFLREPLRDFLLAYGSSISDDGGVSYVMMYGPGPDLHCLES